MPQMYGLLSRDQGMAYWILNEDVTHRRITICQFRLPLVLFPTSETSGNKPISKKN